MADERCRITVVGERKRVDLALPAGSPIAEFIPALTLMCGQTDHPELPAAWSLARAGSLPFPPSTSLDEAGVVDGAVLYLRDVVEGESDSPVVTDVEVLVVRADPSGRTWNSRNRAASLFGCGLLTLLAGVFTLAVRLPGGSAVAGIVAIVLGLTLPLAAWAAGRGERPVPATLRTALALAGCPALALAGYVLDTAAGAGAGGASVAVVAGANIGTLLALASAPRAVTAMAEMFAALTLPVCVLLVALHAGLVEQAAVVSVVAFALLSAAPTVAGRLATLIPAPPGAAVPDDTDPDVTGVVRRSRRVLVALTVLTSVVLAGCLVVLDASDDPYALGLAGCLSLALLLRVGAVLLVPAVLPVLLAGVCGLGTLAVRLFDYAPVPAWSGATITLIAGLVLLTTGTALLRRSRGASAPRPAWPDQLAGVLGVLSVPLGVAVFGMVDYLMGAGGKL